MGERRGEYNGLVRKPEVKRPLARLRHRLEDTIEIELQEIGWWSIDSIDLAQDGDSWQAVVNMVMNIWVPKMKGVLGLTEEVLACEEELCSMN